MKQNHYQTKPITTPTWNTFCRNSIPAEAPTGTWKVEMLQGDRPISDATFEVK